MLDEVNEQGNLCHRVQTKTLAEHTELVGAERAFLIRVFHGTLERQQTIDWILMRKTGRAVQKQKPKIRNVLRMAVYQILFMDVPNSAACNEAVKITKNRNMNGLSGMVNGVLRGIARDVEADGSTEAYLEQLAEGMNTTDRLSFLYAMPTWLILYWRSLYDDATVEKMLKSFLEESKTVIRLREDDRSGEKAMEALLSEGTELTETEYAPNARRMTKAGRLDGSAAFAKGLFAIQDESSILVGNLIPLKAGDTVLDLCAAPGGKTCHIAERLQALGGGTVLARDVSDKKLEAIQENASRLGLSNLRLKVWDAERVDPTMKGAADVVLADLPCSGIGVIGRKPDIKWKTELDDISALAEIQKRILRASADYVKKGGYLVFSTCTITKEENMGGYEELRSLGFDPVDLTPYLPKALQSEPTAKEGYLQLVPGVHSTDGFFFSLFQKN